MRPFLCVCLGLFLCTHPQGFLLAKHKPPQGARSAQPKAEPQKKSDAKKKTTGERGAKPKQDANKKNKGKDKSKKSPKKAKTEPEATERKAPTRKTLWEPKVIYDDPRVLQAVSHVSDKMFNSAKVLLLSALSGPIRHKERAKLLLAFVLMQTKENDSALSLLNELEQSSLPVPDTILLLKGKALFALGRFEEASEALSKVAKSSPQYADAKVLLGDCMMALGNASGAETVFKEVIDSGKKDASLLIRNASALQAQGKTEEAVRTLRNGYFSNIGLNRAPFASALNVAMEGLEATAEEKVQEAKVYLSSFKYEDARVASEEAIRIATDDKTRCEALALRARALSGLRRYKEAVQEFSKVLSSDCKDLVDAPYCLFHGIRSAIRASLDEKALEFYETLTKKYSDSSFCDDVSIWFARGAIRRGDYESARKILLETLSRWQDGDMALEARWLLALSMILEKRYADAKKVIEHALTKVVDPLSGSRFCYFLAWIDMAMGNPHKAKQGFSRCSVAYPMTYYGFLAGIRAGQKGLLASSDSAQGKDSHYPEGLKNAIWLYETGLFSLAGDEASAFEPSSFEDAVVKTLILAKARSVSQPLKIADTFLKIFVATPPNDDNRVFFELAFPRYYQDEVQRASKESHVDPLLIYAVMREESAFNPEALSPAGAIGLLQLMPATAEIVAKKLRIKFNRQSLYQPSINIRLGARLLSELEKTMRHPFFVIAAYNAGAGAILKWKNENHGVPLDLFVELISAEETRNYVKKVFSSYCAYHLLYDQKKPFLQVELGNGLR
jgi:soluble lytic murein transglycosylase